MKTEFNQHFFLDHYFKLIHLKFKGLVLGGNCLRVSTKTLKIKAGNILFKTFPALI